LIERRAGRYDWSSWLPMLTAARATGLQVIWDLCHYGWPDQLDIWSPAFVDRFAAYCAAAARLVQTETQQVPWYCPINEMSYWAWAGAEVGQMNPCALGRGDELKRQLARAYIASVHAIRSVDERARFIVAEPLIHVVGDHRAPGQLQAAEAYRLAQFQAHDMLVGNLSAELGGSPECLDVVGVNFYPHNQWYLGGNTIPMGHYAYRPLRDMLAEVYSRYARPLLITETGAEGSARPYWLHHVCGEVTHSLRAGIPVRGICLYPVLDYPGWDNERICETGLLSVPDADGKRSLHVPLLEELQRQQALLNPVQQPPLSILPKP
jgi:hypothetical protein